MQRRLTHLGATTIALGFLGLTTTAHGAANGDRSADVRRAIVAKKHAKNVILFIGDGMGDSEITIARNYEKGAAGRLAMDGLPLTGAYTTYAVKKGTSDVPDYVTDSAASGTGWATGHKTYNNAVSVDPVTLAPLTTILEKAQQAGFKTGNVTTAELTDATPAVLDAHVSLRGCQGPADMATCPNETKQAGGLGSIAEQTVEHGIDVLLGGGRQRFAQTVTGGPYAGKTVIEQAQALGYDVVTDQAGLDAASPGTKLLGLFSTGNMSLEWTGPGAAPYPGPDATTCTRSNPARAATEPHLADMTARAIELLSAKVKGDKAANRGFFLQVEGASIDKQDHAENPCGQIGETVELDRAIQVALDWAAKNPDTLIVVSADHGHTSQIVEAQSASDHSPGAIATLVTADGQPMVVSYASNLHGRSQSHTGTQVRIAAQGPRAANVVGVTDQTGLFHTLSLALGLE
ncbi:alkaline phosphatase [Candidatus Binatia bacterium]|jgi:alkaline phosphatase|nr:alkaline phosphatase [Candidatus Binatia bacterium]